jgi:hypothetical protein
MAHWARHLTTWLKKVVSRRGKKTLRFRDVRHAPASPLWGCPQELRPDFRSDRKSDRTVSGCLRIWA